MPEKGLQITVPENNPIDNLQTLLRDEEKTKILLLGVPPLSVLSSDFSPSLLEKIIDHLSNFKPDVICLDAIKPESFKSNSNISDFSEIKDDELKIISQLKNKIKLTDQVISSQLDSLLILANYKNKLDLKTRIRLIELFILKYDFYSAALNFLYIKENKIRKDQLDDKIVKKLNSILNRSDENTSIGIQLAYKLKMNRLYSIADGSDKVLLDKISDQLYNQMIVSDVYKQHKREILNQTADNKLKEGLAKKDLFDFFVYLNSDAYSLISTKNNWSVYYKTFLESGLDRTRIGLWEMKNLRTASNIREVSSYYPSKKILVIIDVSKKPFVEEYLNKMTDIKILKLKEIVN